MCNNKLYDTVSDLLVSPLQYAFYSRGKTPQTRTNPVPYRNSSLVSIIGLNRTENIYLKLENHIGIIASSLTHSFFQLLSMHHRDTPFLISSLGESLLDMTQYVSPVCGFTSD